MQDVGERIRIKEVLRIVQAPYVTGPGIAISTGTPPDPALAVKLERSYCQDCEHRNPRPDLLQTDRLIGILIFMHGGR